MPQPKKLFEPWAPPVATAAEVAALKALAAGTASPEQQRRSLDFIIQRVAGTYEEVYCPGEGGNRDTAYALGKRRVGTYIVSLLNADIRKFKTDQSPTEQS
jgi:hypothetical protein